MKRNKEVQEKQTGQQPIWKDLLDLLIKILFIFFCIYLIFTFIYGVERTTDVSMKPAIRDGDLVLYYRLDKYLVSGDVIVFKENDRVITARVVAVAGDTVDITKDGLTINGAVQVSKDIYFDTTQFKNGVDFPIQVKENQVFVLGDNRPSALDSRTFGCVNIDDIQGKVIAVIQTRGI